MNTTFKNMQLRRKAFQLPQKALIVNLVCTLATDQFNLLSEYYYPQ